ncbi:MAG TPA: ComF family protein [Candidatus Acidoferrales bacterium]|nr:ComF family protein [Candidatus Acidoferrales bacterium]
MITKSALAALVSVLFPAPCRICTRPLTNASRIPLCEECLAGFDRIMEPMCQCCGRPFDSVAAAMAVQPLCRLCRASFYAFNRARSFAVYNDALFEAIILMKYEEVARLGYWFAQRLAEIVLQAPEKWRPDVIVPVPLHPDRRRERGYNQAELIARPLAKRLGIPIQPSLLVRTRPRSPRLLLSRAERWKSVHGVYAIGKDLRVDNRRILLVDDVLTTGATLDSCAQALRQGGASEVLGLTVARIVPGRSLARLSLHRRISTNEANL